MTVASEPPMAAASPTAIKRLGNTTNESMIRMITSSTKPPK